MPITAQWSLTVNLTRSIVGSLCEALHGIAHENSGGAIYYPDIVKKQTISRYEWPIKWRNTFPRFHVVMSLVVGSSDIGKIDCYLVDTSENGEAQFTGKHFSSLIEFAQNESLRVFDGAIEQLSKVESTKTNVVFYLDLGSLDPVFQEIQTDDKKFTVIQTRLLEEHKRVSAITVEANEKNQEMAKATALRDVATITALMTLGAGALIKTTTISWDKKTPAPQFIDIGRSYQARSYYPKNSRRFNKGENSPRLSASILFTWSAFDRLNNGDRAVFLNAVFAYQTAKELAHTQSTLSVIAYIASLSAISKTVKKQCKGSIACTECGDLDFRHDLVGDKRAVITTVAELLNIGSETSEYKELKRMIGRVYQEQRSAYVHGATLRHNEYFRQHSAPSALPTNAKYVSDVFFYGRDLGSIEEIVRQSLLRWLALKSGNELPEKELGIDEIRIERKAGFQTSFRAPPKRIVSLRFT